MKIRLKGLGTGICMKYLFNAFTKGEITYLFFLYLNSHTSTQTYSMQTRRPRLLLKWRSMPHHQKPRYQIMRVSFHFDLLVNSLT